MPGFDFKRKMEEFTRPGSEAQIRRDTGQPVRLEWGMSNETQWYYESAGAPVGPVTPAEFAAKRATGAIQASTRVWSQGMAEWKPLAEVPEAPVEGSPPADGPRMERCSECSLRLPVDDLLEYGNLLVCTKCKETFLDKLKQGVRVGNGPWRQGKTLVFQEGAELPRRCLTCNQPAEHAIKKNLSFVSQWLLLLILLGVPGLILYLLIGVLIRKRAKVTAYLCARHRVRRRYLILGNWLLFAASALALIAGIAGIARTARTGEQEDVWLILNLFAILGGLLSLVMAIALTLFRVRKIENGTAYVRGAGRPFLDDLQPWQNY